MAQNLPPIPVFIPIAEQNSLVCSSQWLLWFDLLKRTVESSSGGAPSIKFKDLDFSGGSNITSIQIRNHYDLQNLNLFDDHTIYLLLAGRAGGQIAYGGIAANENLTFGSTANATKGKIFFGANSAYDELNIRLGLGRTDPTCSLEVTSTGNTRVRIVSTVNAQTPQLSIINTSGISGAASIYLSGGGSGDSYVAARGIGYLHLGTSASEGGAITPNLSINQSTRDATLVFGNLYFGTDGAKDIGTATPSDPTSNPGNIYASTKLQAPVVNATTGFQRNNTAPAGSFLRGNGTNFVESFLSPPDLAFSGRPVFLDDNHSHDTDSIVIPGPQGIQGTQGIQGQPGQDGDSLYEDFIFANPQDLTQYFFLPGRSGGQVGYGGTGNTDNLTLSSNSGTKNKILFGTFAAIDEANQRFGVGTQSPLAWFHVYKDQTTGSNAVLFTNYSGVAATIPFQYNNQTARGSFASPGGVVTDDSVGRWGWDGYIAGAVNAFRACASITVAVDGTPNTFCPGRIVWNVATATTSTAEVMRMNSSGNLGIGCIPTSRLEIDGGGFTVATDNTYDCGATGATRFRTIYLGTSVSSPKVQGGEGSGNNLTLTSTTHATKGSILLGANSVYDEVNTRVGLGTTAPQFDFHVVKSAGIGTQAQVTSDTFDSSGILLGGNLFNFRAGRGTAASPGAVSNGDIVLNMQMTAFGNSGGVGQIAGIKAIVDGTYSLSAIPGRLEFHTHNGTSIAVRLTINKTGNLITTAPVRLTGYTVSGLPAGTQGDTAFVTDALAPTYHATVVGGGAVVTPVFYNGTNWIVA